MFSPEVQVVSADTLEVQVVPPAAFPAVVHLAEGHLEAKLELELSFDHLEVSEMQDETQEAAATSGPDPLTLVGPEDRDIDVRSQPLPDSASDSFEAYIRNQQVAFRGRSGDGRPEIELILLVSTFLLYLKHQNLDSHATSDLEDLVQPERTCIVGLPIRRPSQQQKVSADRALWLEGLRFQVRSMACAAPEPFLCICRFSCCVMSCF